MDEGVVLHNDSPQYEVFESIIDLLHLRGNLSNIKNIINTYNASNPPEGPFNMNWLDGQMDSVGLLAHAACNCQLEYIQWFLDHDCNPLARTRHGETVFHIAISHNVIFEIDYGPDDEEPSNSSMGTIMTLLHHMENQEKRTKIKSK